MHVFDGKGLMPLVLSIYPWYWISLVKKWHLLSFINRCVLLNFSKTCFMWSRCSSAVLLNMIISSRKAMPKLKSFNILVMISWKYAGACASPKGSLMHLYFPNGDVNAVLGTEDSSKGI